MSLPFYLNFVVASFVFTFGINGQSTNGPVFPMPPQNFLLSNTCPYSPTITCLPTPTVRPIDGSCNSAKSPYSGKSGTPYIRIAPTVYIENKYPRNISYFGYPLPSPRNISLTFFQSTSNESADLSVITPTFARFVEHDLYKTKLLDVSENTCCNSTQNAGLCDNIYLSPTDPYFAIYKKSCLPKPNSVGSTKLDCKKEDPKQQINENTHTLDLSNIYGSTKDDSDRLRTKTDGLLKMNATNFLLPRYALPECQLPSPNSNNEYCFDAGDLRVNIDPLIMTMYTIWVRHHNAVATKLKVNLKDASDEDIFQTARKIVIAQYQHIVYTELLPVFDKNTSLMTPPAGTTSHSASVTPTIFNTFSLVYTSIIDSMVPSKIVIDSTDIKLDSVYYKPEKLFETDGIQKLLEAMQTTKAEMVDRFVVEELTNSYLQELPGQGTDKVALNLQQSRENGAPVYIIFYSVINKETGAKSPDVLLNKIYPEEIDIELLPGLFAETPVTDALYGKTTQKLMDKQFKELQEGDRFFYTHEGVFTPDQLDEIRNITLAKILCTNGELTDIVPNALELQNPTENQMKKCSLLMDIDICLWSTVQWSDWDSICVGELNIFTRQCSILPGSTCKCKGKAIEIRTCSTAPVNNIINIDTVQKIYATFYKNFDVYGIPLNSNNSSFADILKKTYVITRP